MGGDTSLRVTVERDAETHSRAGVAPTVADLIAPLRAAPGAAAVLSDIDGTLAPIVDDPERASVPAETREVLRALAGRYALVACVSGRRALDARRIVGVGEILYAGNHGFELLQPGADEPVLHPAVGARADRARAFVEGLDREALGAAGVRFEDKGPIQALHWRGAGAEAEVLVGAVAEAAGEADLVPRAGRKVLEIRPVSGIDKGTVVERLVRDAGVLHALFGGDDATDLDGFRALRELRRAEELRTAVCVGVSSDEQPAGLEGGTDAVVMGTAGFLGVLRALAAEGD
jgi:trehalose 6-phosphate phosphatase